MPVWFLLLACRLLPGWRQSWFFKSPEAAAALAGLQLQLCRNCRTPVPGVGDHPIGTVLLPLATSPTKRQQVAKLHRSPSSQSGIQASSICSELRCVMLPSAARKLIKRQQRGANDVQMNTSTSVRQKAASLGSHDGGLLSSLMRVLRGLIRKYLQCASELERTNVINQCLDLHRRIAENMRGW